MLDIKDVKSTAQFIGQKIAESKLPRVDPVHDLSIFVDPDTEIVAADQREKERLAGTFVEKK